jgi:hypothetical protein
MCQQLPSTKLLNRSVSTLGFLPQECIRQTIPPMQCEQKSTSQAPVSSTSTLLKKSNLMVHIAKKTWLMVDITVREMDIPPNPDDDDECIPP